LQIQLIPDDGETLWQVLEGYLSDIRGETATMNLFEPRGDSPARESLPHVLRGRDRRVSSGAGVNAGRN
jgi:hypothetical protein